MIEFKHTKTIEITVYELESNSADEPGFYKVVWTSADQNKTNEVECWQQRTNLYELTNEWQKLSAPFNIEGIPTIKKSIDLLQNFL